MRDLQVADDEPAPPEDAITYGAELLGMSSAPEGAFEEADLTPMARSFYGDSRRISNALIQSELGVRLAYRIFARTESARRHGVIDANLVPF